MMRLTREDFHRAIPEARNNDEDYNSQPFRFGIPEAKETLLTGLEEACVIKWIGSPAMTK